MPFFVPIGENCLVEQMLARHGFSKERYPFDYTQCNVEHLTQIVASDFADFLNPAYLKPGRSGISGSVFNAKYTFRHDIYCPTSSTPVQIGHGSILTMADSIERFFKLLRSSAPIVFLYNYRYDPKQNPVLVAQLLLEFLALVRTKRSCASRCLFWYQTICDGYDIGFERYTEDLLGCRFCDPQSWNGDENWRARTGDALFARLFQSDEFSSFVSFDQTPARR